MVGPFSHPGIVFYWAMKHDSMEEMGLVVVEMGHPFEDAAGYEQANYGIRTL